MNTKQLRQKILDLAIKGKLVPQDPNDEPASKLIERIREEKEQLIKEGKLKRDKNESYIFVGDDKLHYEKFADGSVVCIEDEIPFEIPESWAWCHLSDVVAILNGDRGQNYPALPVSKAGRCLCSMPPFLPGLLQQMSFLSPAHASPVPSSARCTVPLSL